MRTLPLLSAFCCFLSVVLPAAAQAGPAVWAEGDRLTVVTEAVEVLFERGVLVRLANRLTGEVIAVGDPTKPPREACGLIALDGKAWWSESASAVETRSDGIRWTWPDGAEMRLAVAAEGADVVFRLSGKAPAPGLVGCRWALPGIALRNRRLYVPETYTGLLVDASTPPGKLDLGEQPGWSHAAHLAFVQGEKGTLGWWPEERSGCAVRFHGAVLPGMAPPSPPKVGRVGGAPANVPPSPPKVGGVGGAEQAWLALEAHGEPPYTERREVAVAPWRLAATRGGWHALADRYRREVLLSLRPRAFRQPAWMRDIGFCLFYYTSNTDDLEALAKQVDPKRTLLVFPFHRKQGFDQGYPDWSPSEAFPAVHRRALELGFRTCLWSNGGAIDPRMPLYEELKRFQKRNPLTGSLLGWKWHDDPAKWERTTCAQIHRGSSEYRRILVEGMKAVTEQLRPSAWHIDYSIGIADGLGRVEGLTDFEGFYKLLEELRAALPADVALRGEGLALGNAANIDCAELFPYGAPERGLPVCAYLYTPDVATTAHVVVAHQRQAMAFGAGSVASWLAWLEPFGVMPTGNVGSNGHGSTPGAEALYGVARHFQRLRLRPDFSAPWAEDTIFRWRSAEGVAYACARTPTGARLAGGGEVLYERLKGVTEASVTGRLRGWPAADESRAFGLNPGVDYLVEPDAPPARTQVLELPKGAYLSTCVETEDAVLLRLEPSSQYRAVADLQDPANAPRTGVLYGGTRPAEIALGARFAPAGGSCGSTARFGFETNLPWKPGTPGWAQVYGEFPVQLPDTPDPLRLEAFAGLRDTTRESDGITFLATVDGREVAREHVAERAWRRIQADLSAFRGKRVVVRLLCDPGPKHHTSWDLGLWADAAIRRGAGPDAVRLRFPTKPVAVCDAAGAPLPQTAGETVQVQTPIPGSVIAFLKEPAPAPLPFDLAAAPRASGYCDPQTYGCLVPAEYGQSARVEGKPAIQATTRGQGRGMLVYTLRLPAGKPVLRFTPRVAAATKTGQFSVEVNGEVRWLKLISQATPEPEHSVDLSAFAEKRIVLSLCYATHGAYPWGGSATWLHPRIEAAP